MNKSWKWILTAAPLLALTLAMPSAARAQCTLTQTDFDGNGLPDMNIQGAPGTSGNITINAAPEQATVTVVCGGIANKVYAKDFYVFQVYLRGAATITFNVTGDWVGKHKKLAIQTGINRNVITIGGTGTMTDSSLLVEIQGMANHDSVTVAPPVMNHSTLEMHADMADGNDTIIANLKNPITNGSVVALNAALGDGNPNSGVNIFRVTQSALIDATVSVDMDGGQNANLTDYGYLTLAGPIGSQGRLIVRSDLGEGPNSFKGAVALPTFSVAAGGEVHVDVGGRAGNDALSFSRTGTLAPAGGAVMAGLLDINLDGGAGADILSVDLAGGGLKLDGTLRIRENGGPGPDNLTALVDVDASSTTPNLDVYLYGGAGGDRLNATIQDNGPRLPANYGLGGSAFLDGGVDSGDICTIGAANTGLIHKRNCEG